ncbi:hypothetical protein [Thalassotalea insulae]|uniref:hypothetical protein n=1 Tax=Thalassotalea insulae TaxID=2056778 RepID=UPI0024E1582A|nr:hypothetical protein [Thalassotalea insulae]
MLLITLPLLPLSYASPINKDNVIVISALPDNPIISWVKDVVHQAYTNIGFNVKFQEYPPMRGISEANSGNVDAVLVRAELIEQSLPDYIRVPVALGHGDLVLYCQLSMPCSKEALDDKHNLIGTISGSIASAQFMVDKKASSYQVPRDSQISKMLQASRLNYILSIDVKGYGNYSDLDNNQYQRVVLKSFDAFHYLHKSKSTILLQLQQALLEAKLAAEADFPILNH